MGGSNESQLCLPAIAHHSVWCLRALITDHFHGRRPTGEISCGRNQASQGADLVRTENVRNHVSCDKSRVSKMNRIKEGMTLRPVTPYKKGCVLSAYRL